MIPTGAVANQVSSKPQESARTPPEARGLLSDTTRRGTLSKNQKCCLNLAKIKAKRLPPGLCRILRFARGLAPRPHTKGQKHPAEALSPRPSRRGLAPKGLGWDANSPIRSRPGSTNILVTSVPTKTPLTKHHVQINAPNYSCKRQPYSGTVRAERPTGQGTGRNRGYLPLC